MTSRNSCKITQPRGILLTRFLNNWFECRRTRLRNGYSVEPYPLRPDLSLDRSAWSAQMASIAIVRSTNQPPDGLSAEETAEFERLDALAALDEAGKPAWVFEGEPTSPRERRWLELYTNRSLATRRWK